MSVKKDSPRTYCPMCGRKMTLSNVFKEPRGRISWKFVCHYCDTVTQFYDEATEKEKDTMTKENGRTYENSSELDEALKKIHMSLRAYRSRLDGEVLYINFFDDALVDIKCPDNNHIDGYWFQWNAQTSGNYKTSKIIRNVMDVVNNLLAQFDTYTPEGFFDPDGQNSEDEEDYYF